MIDPPRYFNGIDVKFDDAIFRVDLTARVGGEPPSTQVRLFVAPAFMRQFAALVTKQLHAFTAASGPIRVSRRGAPESPPLDSPTLREHYPNWLQLVRAKDGSWFLTFELRLRKKKWRPIESLDRVRTVTTVAEVPWMASALEEALKAFDASRVP